jgi:chromosome segregation protein
MYLKKIEMKGFKSFADNITLEFKNCITSIIGPNGSGKSNIADAIRWVLGEQSLKNLRGSKSQDIIFAGTQFRKALSFAEVTLTLDNSDRSLDVDFDEVSICRRLYRSGESEFYINKSKCRLKDVVNLLLDTGIGKDGYSVIGQGKVEELLSAKSEERRNIFDEAAGIMKYKVRKAEALSKLEKTEENLSRINDIITEIGSGLATLEEKAKKARTYLDLRQKLKDYETATYVRSIQSFQGKLDEINKEKSLVEQNIKDQEKIILEKGEQIKKNTQRQEQLEIELENLKKETHEIEGEIARKSGDIRVWEEKHKKYLSYIANLRKEIEASQNETDILKENKVKLNERLASLNADMVKYESKLKQFEEEMQSLLATMNREEARIETLKMEMMEKLDQITEVKTSISTSSGVLDNYRTRIKEIENDISVMIREKDSFLSEKENTEKLLNETEEKENKVIKEKQETENRYKTLTERLRMLDVRLNEAKSAYQAEKSKYNMLYEMEKSYDGYNRSVKAVLNANDNGILGNVRIYGTLADIIDVEEKYETAVEMAVGGAMQNIVTEDEEDAKAVIGFLRKGNIGVATMMPVSSMQPRRIEKNVLEELGKMKGFVDTCDRLVSYDPRFDNVIKNLLGRVVIAEDYDSAVLMAKKFSYSYKIVTLDGDIFQTGGSITGGSVNKKGTGLLSRKRLLNELKTSVSRLESGCASLAKSKEKTSEEALLCENKLEILEKEKHNAELERIKFENRLESLLERLESLEFKIENAREEKEQYKKECAVAEKELNELTEKLLSIEKDVEDRKRVIMEFESRNKTTRQRKDDLVTDITDYKVSLNSVKDGIETVKNSLTETDRAAEALQRAIEQKQSEIRMNEEKIENVKAELQNLQREIKALNEKMTGAGLTVVKLEEERKNLRLEIEECRKILDEGNKNILLFKEEESRLQVRGAKLESDMDALKSRMFDEYEITYAEAVNRRNTAIEEEISPRKISELKNQINALGSVDVTSISEYAETKARYDFLTKQQQEMEEAKEKLKRVVYEMNSVMKAKFSEKLKEINQNFKKVFRELFDGGRAELVLADDENILESDIQVFVQPPGKNLQNMMLLSGGERSLSAIALLFSIMMLKPTPFCVLDEIEAALDDVNVYRFIDYLRTLSDKTQFILITHRKGTMEGSDFLYGVTMQEHGVSHVVSVDTNQIEKTG